MNWRFKVVLAASFGLVVFGGWVLGVRNYHTANTSAVANIAAGKRLYGEQCASCHGANLEGQADWRSLGSDGLLPAPPHDETGHTWHHSDRLLFDYIKLGGQAEMAAQGIEFDSGMPGFGETLDDRQILDILSFIKSTWPERHREVQSARSEADRSGGEASD